jgi:RHS repeat-associated protein
MGHFTMKKSIHGSRICAALLTGSLLVGSGCRRARVASSSDDSSFAPLAECDPAVYIPCISQVAFISIPVHDAGLYLTYSSAWANGVPGHRAWDVGSLGLGGWSINAVQQYDAGRRILQSGDGSWRFATGVKLPSGELAVPSYDGALVFIFDTTGRHVRTVDGRLGTVLMTIGYDSAGRLALVDGTMSGQSVHLSVQRATGGTARSVAGTDAAATKLDVDANGRLTGVTDPAGGLTRIAWDSGGHVVSRTDPVGAVTRYSYDASGRIASIIDPDSVVQRFERDASNKSVEVSALTGLGGRQTYRAEYVDGSIRRTFTDRDGSVSTETVDARGARDVRLSDGTRIAIGADPNGIWGMAAPVLTPVVRTRSDGVVTRRDVRYALQPQHGLPYMLAGSVTTIINGERWTESSDPSTHTKVLVDPAGRRTTDMYDSVGHTIAHAAPGKPPMRFAYDGNGRMTSATWGSGKDAPTTRYAYDASTGEIKVAHHDGTIERIIVDAAGRPVRSAADDGSTTIATYDAADQLQQLRPAGGMAFTLGISPGGRLTAFVPPLLKGDSSLEMRSYDADGRLATITQPDGHLVSISYDRAGRVDGWTFDRGKRTASYDAKSGLRSRSADPSGVTTTYGYTGSEPTRLAWTGPINGSVAEKRDANGRIVGESVDGANVLSLMYDGSGYLARVGPLVLTRDAGTGLVTRTTLGVIETKQSCDSSDRLARVITATGGRTLLDVRYTRDARGRIRSVATTGSNGGTSITGYTYDRNGRLSAVTDNGHVTESDSYDPAGNRIGVSGPGARVMGEYDDRDRTVAWSARRYGWAANGSLTRVVDGPSATSFGYDDFGALRDVVMPGGRRIEYLIDADGRRVGRSVAGRLTAGYLYRPDGSIVAETDSAGSIVSRFGYDDSGHLALIVRDSVFYRVVTDAIGSPLLVIDSRSGVIADAVTYDTWGNVQRETTPGFIPFGFAGGLRDPDTNLLRFGARDYDPATGRFTAPDPLRFRAGDANLYRYTAGDPVNRVDPRGTCVDAEQTNFLPEDLAVSRIENEGLCPPDPTGQPPGGNPPQGNPPPGDPPSNPPSNPPGSGAPWQCQGIACLGPQGAGCVFGSCNRNPFGFTCNAVFCQSPDPDNWCFYCSIGDPHLQAGNGFRFDLQTEGEFLATMSRDGTHLIQVRQQPYIAGSPVAVNTAVAADVDGDRVGVYAAEPAFLVINGASVTALDFDRTLPHGGWVERRGGLVAVRWHDGSRLAVTRIGPTVNYNFIPAASIGPLSGLLGGSSDGSADALSGRDASLIRITDPAFPKKLYHPFADSWRINQSESLFHYWPGESTATFSAMPIPPHQISTHELSKDAADRANSICRAIGVRSQPALDDCTLDVGITGLAELAEGSIMLGTNPSVLRTHTAGAVANASQSSSASVTSGTTAAAARGQFAIRIGDTVAPDRPARGAGTITRAGQQQSYSFSGVKGQVVYVAPGPCSGAQPSFDLRTQRDSLLRSVIGNCNVDLGRQILPATGTYRIVASTVNKTDVSRYGFSVQPVPADQHFNVRLPLAVAPNTTGRGPGSISAKGARQFFDFSTNAGTVVHVEGRCKTCAHLLVRVSRIGDTSDFGFVDVNYLKHDWTLPSSGAYTIEISSAGFVGEYGFTASQLAKAVSALH